MKCATFSEVIWAERYFWQPCFCRWVNVIWSVIHRCWSDCRGIRAAGCKKVAPRENKSNKGKVKDVISHHQKGVLFAHLTMVLISFENSSPTLDWSPEGAEAYWLMELEFICLCVCPFKCSSLVSNPLIADKDRYACQSRSGPSALLL